MTGSKQPMRQRAAQDSCAAGASSSSSSSPSDNPQVQKLAALLTNIRQAWGQHGKRLTTWWASLDKEARLKFLLDWCPYMPLARDKPYLFVDGKKEDVSGASLFTPEWNQQDLAEGTALIDLIKGTAEIPEAPSEEEPGNAVWKLCVRHVPFACMVTPKLNSKLPLKEQQYGVVLLSPTQLGEGFIVNQMVPEIQQWLQQGLAIRSLEWEALMLRLDVHCSSMAMCLDTYRLDVLGRDGYKAAGPAFGCANCRAVQRSDGSGGRLLACSACGCVFYCSRDCQKAHWREHKPHCKPAAAKTAGASSSSSSSSQGEACSSAAAAEKETS